MTRTSSTILAATAAGVILLAGVGRAAAPMLIAIGSIPAYYEDFADATSAPLENGVPGNILGGVGSGLAYLGGDYFLGLPDRGPNAKDYNDCTDDTTSYIPRVHTLHLTLAPSDPAVTTLPFTLTPMVVDTQLFWSNQSLVYGAGCGAVGSGEPALNTEHRNFFSGRSDNFQLGGSSTHPLNGRLDPEGIRVSNDRRTVFVSDEYGPYVYQFDRLTGRRLRTYTLPAKFAVANPSSMEAVEFTNPSGRVANKGMEGLAITPDGKTLVGAMQSPLLQEGGDVKGLRMRLVTIDIRTGATREYAYQAASLSKKSTISEILAVNDHQFLVDERDGGGLGDDSAAIVKQVFLIDITGATDVSNTPSLNPLPVGVTPVSKTLFLDVVAALTAKGIAAVDIPAKLEGMAFGQDVKIGGQTKHTLYVSTDNDFLSLTKKTVSGVATMVPNPNMFFVFAFDDADLPGFRAQQFRNYDDRNDRGER